MNDTTGSERYDALYTLVSSRRSVREYAARPIGRETLLRMLGGAQGITDAQGRRAAPSAHGLNPLALSVIVRRVAGMQTGLYAYEPEVSVLQRLTDAPAEGALLATSLSDDTWLEQAAAVIVIGADHEAALRHFADQQPDGLRGARYIDVESGAVAQLLYLGAQAEGLGGVFVMGVDDAKLQALLSLPAPYKPVALFCLGHPISARIER